MDNFRYQRTYRKSKRNILKTQAKQRDRQRLVLKQRVVLLSFGAIVILVSILWDYIVPDMKKENSAHSEEIRVSDSFAFEPVKVDEKLIAGQGKTIARQPIRIIIPSVGINVLVKEAKVVKGYWQVFSDSAGYGSGSGLPGEKGNQVIFAHAREKLFLPLRKVSKNHLVYVFTKDDWFEYRVVDIREVAPDRIDVIAHRKEEVLTLYTCSGYADNKRFIVSGEPVKRLVRL